MKREIFPDPRSAKQEMRRTLRAALKALTPAYRAEASLVICETAAELPAFVRANCVALFAPLPSEPDIHPLIEEAWAHRKRVALPFMVQDESQPRLEWRAVTQWSEVVEPGPFGLREPDPAQCPLLDSRELECTFIPGMAFDKTGLRLGRGGGFYDRFLGGASTAELPRFGLMFGCQEVEAVPCEPHDQILPAVITEDGLFRFGNEIRD